MDETKKVLQMNFATEEGGSRRLTVSEPKASLTPANIKSAMDAVVSSGAFIGAKGAITGKTSACYVTQAVEKLEIN